MARLHTIEVVFDVQSSEINGWYPAYLFDLIELRLCPLQSTRIRKIRLVMGGFESRSVIDYDDALEVQIPFDIAKFVRDFPTLHQRHLWLNQQMGDWLSDLGREYGWDCGAVETAIQRVVEERFYFDGPWGNPKKSPDRKRAAQLWVTYFPGPEIYLHVVEGGRCICCPLISVGKAGFTSVKQACSNIKWKSNHQVLIYNENLRDFWQYEIDTMTLTYSYNGTNACDGHKEFILGNMYLKGYIVLRDELKGKGLLEESARKGYKHAVKALSGITDRETDST